MRTALALYLTFAATPVFAKNLEVEIVRQLKDRSRQSQKLTLEVGDTRCSSVSLRAGKGLDRVKVCPEKDGFGLELHLEDAELEAHAPTTPGQRVIIGRFERADGSSLEVATTPR